MHFLYIATILSAGLTSAYDLPDNLKQIYNNHKVRHKLDIQMVCPPL